MIELGHYGLHWLHGVAVLLQGSGPQTAIPGLKVEAKLAGRARCNHQIDLTATAELPDLSDPLIQAMLPVPRSGPVPFLDDPSGAATIWPLARMSSPITSIFRPLWSMTPYALERELSASNVQPLVLMDVQSQHRTQLEHALSFARFSPRPILLVGSPLVPNRPGMERITTSAVIDESLPWEAIGATVLRRRMLGETDPSN